MKNTLIRLPQLRQSNGLSKATIYRRIKDGLLPPSISLGGRSVAWLESEIEAINDAYIAGKNEQEIKDAVANMVKLRGKAA